MTFGVSSSSAGYFPLSFFPLTLMRDALVSMTEVLPRGGSSSVDTRSTASTVDIEVAFSSLSVGVQAQGECGFERIGIAGAGALKDRRTFTLPNSNNGEEQLLLAVRKGTGGEVERRSTGETGCRIESGSGVGTDAGATTEEVW